jgi:hypothetical protein
MNGLYFQVGENEAGVYIGIVPVEYWNEHQVMDSDPEFDFALIPDGYEYEDGGCVVPIDETLTVEEVRHAFLAAGFEEKQLFEE